MDGGGAPIRTGETLKEKYELLELLGSGGMGDVYRARNTLVNRVVAIKVLHAHHSKNQEVVGRFMQEAKAANAVSHRNIVDVLDIDTDEGGVPFIVQEYLEGEDLAMRLETPPHTLTPDEALDLLIPVIEACGVAHENGVVHRDLKPDNIFLALVEDAIVPKILDFGISKVEVEEQWQRRTGGGDAPATSNPRMTVAGAAMGTPAYMSPEQIRDPRTVDARTDIWAFGVMLYETLSGRMPFDADDLATLFAVINTQEPPALERVNKGVPKALARIVHRCLRPERTARFKDGRALAKALNEFRERATAAATMRAPSASLVPGAYRPLSPSRSSAPASSSNPPVSRSNPPVSRSNPPVSRSNPPVSRSNPPLSRSNPPVIVAKAEASIPPNRPSKPSMDPSQWELDIGTNDPPPSMPPRRSAKPIESSPPDAAGAFGFDDDPLESDVKLELADDAPPVSQRSSVAPVSQRGAAASQHPSSLGRPRVALTAERSDDQPRRGIKVRRREEPKSTLFGAFVRLLLCGAVVAGLVLGAPRVAPAGIDAMRIELGGQAWLYYSGGAIACALALIWVAAAGMRRVSYTLFLAAIGLTMATGAAVAATGIIAAPGIIPGTMRKAALFAAPWASLVTVIGLSGFAFSRGRTLRADNDHPLFGLLLIVASLIGVGAVGYMLVTGPRASLEEVSAMNLVPIEEQTRTQLSRFAVVAAGARALDGTPVPAKPKAPPSAPAPVEQVKDTPPSPAPAP